MNAKKAVLKARSELRKRRIAHIFLLDSFRKHLKLFRVERTMTGQVFCEVL